MIEPFQGISPVIGEKVYIAPNASVIGDVELGDFSSVWHGAVVRGDCWKIKIGSYTNIQDLCVCHVTTGGPELVIGSKVTVGHGAILHSCHIGDGCLIGMGAVILDGAVIGGGSIIAANSVVLEGAEIPPGSLVAGIPGSIKKDLAEPVGTRLESQAMEYHSLALAYMGEKEFILDKEKI